MLKKEAPGQRPSDLARGRRARVRSVEILASDRSRREGPSLDRDQAPAAPVVLEATISAVV
ncbi:MAG: hypothetical protein OSB09_11565, partial [Planctomycetota bacterium]|nr:hypothetical protein [Planctomycetota bacterium]